MKYAPRTANANRWYLNEIGYAPFCPPTLVSVLVFVTVASLETWLLPPEIPLWGPVVVVEEEMGPVGAPPSLSTCTATDKILT